MNMNVPLIPQDDLMGHQTPAPLLFAGNGHPNFIERYWYTGAPTDGTDFIFEAGLGYYPNRITRDGGRGIMDGYCGITVGRKQHNFRASRYLGDRPLDTTVGPLRIEIIEGLKTHRWSLAENESGLSFEFQFEATFPATRELQNYRERDGVVEEDLTRVAQFCRYRGWFVVDGKRHVVDPATWMGTRDHSWGIRSEMRVDPTNPPVQVHKNLFWIWAQWQFENMGLNFFLKEKEPGRPFYLSGYQLTRGSDGVVARREIKSVKHDIQWADDPLGQTIASGDFHIEFDEGPACDVHMLGLTPRFYLMAGMYGGLNGWKQGGDMGVYHSEHEVWDLGNEADRKVARTLSDHSVRVTCDGITGHGVIEYGVATGYPKYIEPQRFPCM
jgi:hypothetical protein